MSSSRPVEPAGWPSPRGYANGRLCPPGCRLLHVAGQIGWDREQRLVDGGFAGQFERALANVLAVVAAAGGEPADLVRLTIYVTDREAYVAARRELGEIWRRHLGGHYPAMALLVVAGLLEPGALVEMEAVAALAAEEDGDGDRNP